MKPLFINKRSNNLNRIIGMGLHLVVLALLAQPAFAAECQSCIARKKALCSKECALVSEEKQLDCQNGCIREYCEHRCSPDHPDLPLSGLTKCEPCLDTQFNLCDKVCTNGSARILALCKLDCAGKRCAGFCGK